MEKESKINKPEQTTKLEVTISSNGLPCIEVRNPTPELRRIIKGAIRTNHMDDPSYKLRQDAGAFLQGDSEDWILVEFWQKDYQLFVDYLNSLIEDINNNP